MIDVSDVPAVRKLILKGLRDQIDAATDRAFKALEPRKPAPEPQVKRRRIP